ncbi:MAG: tRNA 2-thiocytidine(32) synthetase TtcA [Deltaproteobacteria bacterium]|nr:tRNA 2-thiocytidine(32) synthetase TtcA [Deltaproteobacteria bacterium]
MASWQKIQAVTDVASGEQGRGKPRSDLEHLIMRRVGQAIGDHRLIEAGDRILVAVSGGKDSFALLSLLELHRRRFEHHFELLPVFVDAGWDPTAGPRVKERMAAQGLEVEVISRGIKQCVEDKLRPGSNPCALCARLRRGFLYDLAPERGCNKIALGHHLDDTLETLLLNLFFTGQLKAMPTSLRSDDGRNTVIRPLLYVEDALLKQYAIECDFEPVSVACPYVTGKTEMQREQVRRLIEGMADSHPRVRRSMLAALKHVRPSHLLDHALSRDDSG